MIKYSFLLGLSLIVLSFSSCGDAAENRQKMHDRAKVFQDSIANGLRQSMAEAEAPVNPGVIIDTAAARMASQAIQSGAPR